MTVVRLDAAAHPMAGVAKTAKYRLGRRALAPVGHIARYLWAGDHSYVEKAASQ